MIVGNNNNNAAAKVAALAAKLRTSEDDQRLQQQRLALAADLQALLDNLSPEEFSVPDSGIWKPYARTNTTNQQRTQQQGIILTTPRPAAGLAVPVSTFRPPLPANLDVQQLVNLADLVRDEDADNKEQRQEELAAVVDQQQRVRQNELQRLLAALQREQAPTKPWDIR